MSLDYSGASPVATIREKIFSGRGGPGLGEGVWTGQGITSRRRRCGEPDTNTRCSRGRLCREFAVAAGLYTTFRGVPVDDSAILIAFTRTGDANLDDVVGDDDVTVLGATYQPHVPNASVGPCRLRL